MRLLVAEDDPRLLKTLTHIFESNCFSVDAVSNGEDALTFALTEEYDGLVLDIMMPGADGLTVLRQLRGRKINTPVLLLTARSQVEERVEGLDAGADDYLPKPFASAELLARVRAMLRRKENFTPDLLNWNGIRLNRSTYQLGFERQEQALSGKEYQIMEMLMESPKAILSTSQFLTHIWGWEANVDTSVVWVHVSNLRKKLAAIKAPAEIRFVRGAGYQLEEKA